VAAASFAPQPGQNFLPSVGAPHSGHFAATSFPLALMRWFSSRKRSFATWVLTCSARIEDSSSSAIGAQRLHISALRFQQVCSHSQSPQRRHLRKRGFTSSTAARRAASCCGPPTARWTS